MLHSCEGGEGLLWGTPVKWTHGEIIVLPLSDGELGFEIVERKEPVRSVELLVVLAVTALDLAVMPRREGTDELVVDTEFGERRLKERNPLRGA